MREPEASHFDGKTAERHSVLVEFTQTHLVIDQDGEEVARWAYADIRQEPSDEGVLRLACPKSSKLARLEIDDEDQIAQILQRCHALAARGGWSSLRTLVIVGGLLAVALGLFAGAIALLPRMAAEVAPLVPGSLERRIGKALYRQALGLFGSGMVCGGGGPSSLPARAETALAARLDEAARRDGGQAGDTRPQAAAVRLFVIRSSLAGITGLPDGRILILDGLLQSAESADEIAGAIAHEMGHVARRDRLRALIAASGPGFVLGTVLGDFAGPAASFYPDGAVLQPTFPRAIELAADGDAIDMMHIFGRSPVPFGNLLTRLSRAAPGGEARWSPLVKDPATPDRFAAMRSSGLVTTAQPIISDEQFLALRHICD